MQVPLYKHLFLCYDDTMVSVQHGVSPRHHTRGNKKKELTCMIVFHIDVNNAYLSWESVYRLTERNETLDLRDIPAVIGGDEKSRHGIVLAKSMPAKAFGIQTAETLAEARKKCPDIHIVPPRHHIYQLFSHKLISYLRKQTPVVEQYSIDEAFADMTDCPLLRKYTPVEAAHYIRKEIYHLFGYTVNIGVSTNKLLAKMASDFEKPNKVHSLFPEEIEKKMWPLPVGDLFFVGNASAKKLYNLGIRTIGELARFDRNILKSHMGKHGTLIHDYANGIDHSPVLSEQPENKGYGNSTTLSRDVTDAGEAKKILLSLCESVGSRLRADDFLAHVVAVSIKDSQFKNSSHQCTMPAATNVTSELYHHVCALFEEAWDGSPIRLLGVSTSKLTRERSRQLNLLDKDYYIRQGKMEETVDEIRKRFGDDAIFRASGLEK